MDERDLRGPSGLSRSSFVPEPLGRIMCQWSRGLTSRLIILGLSLPTAFIPTVSPKTRTRNVVVC